MRLSFGRTPRTPLCLLVGLLACLSGTVGGAGQIPGPVADRARDLLQRARGLVFTLPPEQDRSKAAMLHSIAMVQAEAGFVDEALLTVDAIVDPDRPTKTVALLSVAVTQAERGDADGALRTALRIEGKPWRSRALTQVGRAQAREGFISGALQTVNDISEPGDRGLVLYEVVGAQLLQDDIGGARKTAERIGAEPSKTQAAKLIEQWEAAQALGGRKFTFHIEARPTYVVTAKTPSPGSILAGDSEYKQLLLPTSKTPLVMYGTPEPGLAEAQRRIREALESFKKGDHEGALKTLRAATQLPADMSLDAREIAAWQLGVTLAECGDIPAALQQAALVAPDEDQSPSTVLGQALVIQRIAVAQAAAGDPDPALARAETEPTLLRQAATLVGVAEGILRRAEMQSRKTSQPRPH